MFDMAEMDLLKTLHNINTHTHVYMHAYTHTHTHTHTHTGTPASRSYLFCWHVILRFKLPTS